MAVHVKTELLHVFFRKIRGCESPASSFGARSRQAHVSPESLLLTTVRRQQPLEGHSNSAGLSGWEFESCLAQ